MHKLFFFTLFLKYPCIHISTLLNGLTIFDLYFVSEHNKHVPIHTQNNTEENKCFKKTFNGAYHRRFELFYPFEMKNPNTKQRNINMTASKKRERERQSKKKITAECVFSLSISKMAEIFLFIYCLPCSMFGFAVDLIQRASENVSTDEKKRIRNKTSFRISHNFYWNISVCVRASKHNLKDS